MMQKNLLRGLLAVLLVGATAQLAQAQAEEDPENGGPLFGAQPTAVPIDGGASLLLAGGVAYGLKKLRQRRAR